MAASWSSLSGAPPQIPRLLFPQTTKFMKEAGRDEAAEFYV
jgi:hypothetical protein